MGRLHLRALCALAAFLPALLGAQTQSSTLSRDLDRLARGEQVAGLPAVENVVAGPLVVPAGAAVQGTVVATGPVEVHGTVNGSVVSLAGDVVVHPTGVVAGDAIAVGGRVRADGGRIDGEMRTLSTLPTLAAAATAAPLVASPSQRTFDAIRLVAGTFGVLLIVALGVLLFAGENLDEVVNTLELRFARAFWIGLVGQLAILPALVVLLVALAVSILGILLIPFAIVAYAIAVAGLVTLGFLAVARLIGGGMLPLSDHSARSRAFRGLAAGIAVFFVLWMIVAALTWAPLAATVVRGAALAATWAAMTLGLGAAILSRAGTHRRMASGDRPLELAVWQTPTPITGVVAARRTSRAVGEVR